jgi:hypothetical protein
MAGHPKFSNPAFHLSTTGASVDAIAKQHLVAIDRKIARLTALRGEVNLMLKACAKGWIAQCKVIDVLASYSD